MVSAAQDELDKFREKIERELKAGVVTLVLLLAVARTGPDYGYRLLKTISEGSGGRFQLKEGTAYPVLANLERAGFVSSYWGEGAGGPPRKYYQVTAQGRKALQQTLADWGDLVDVVRVLGDAWNGKGNK